MPPARPHDALLAVRVQPRSRGDVVAGVVAGELRIRVVAPPVGGAANEAARRLVARWLGIPASSVAVIRGATGRRKLLRIRGVTRCAVAARLATARGPVDKGPARD